MTELRFENYSISAASLGEENPLPDLRSETDIHSSIQFDETTISAEEAKYIGWGGYTSILPYTTQDGYDRERKPRDFHAAVLENKHLKAVFLPELGGRLWSLFDKDNNRELLHRNPVFQPANLAIRNAWFSGGVEWNVGLVGHTPFTCSQMHVEKLSLKDRTPVLRMFEFERIRGVAYRIDAFLPAASKFLFLKITIENTNKKMTPTYWWSNIAVDENEGTRVIAPAAKAFRFDYTGKVAKILLPTPESDKTDVSYTTNIRKAMDFFFDIPNGRRRWIASLDKSGKGLVQTSTDLLRGRKLFLWGMDNGGRNWQKFLSNGKSRYIEIQAGLARTQLEHLPMPGKASWQWVEAYGSMSVDPVLAHGDWREAQTAVESELDFLLPVDKMEESDILSSSLRNHSGRHIAYGSGWGAFEAAARSLLGIEFATSLVFDESTLGEEQLYWLELLKNRHLPDREPLEKPYAHLVAPYCRTALEKAVKTTRKWNEWYHLGVLLAHDGETEAAKAALEKSISLNPSPWAYRCLAVLSEGEGDMKNAVGLYKTAVAILPHRSICIESVKTMMKYDPAEVPGYIASLPLAIRSLPRIRFAELSAFVKLGRLDEAEDSFNSHLVIPDIREGEVSLTDVWFELQARREAARVGKEYDGTFLKNARDTLNPPGWLDFRMR
jgi:hypothetical protein